MGRMRGRAVVETNQSDVFIPMIPQIPVPRQSSMSRSTLDHPSREHDQIPVEQVGFEPPIVTENEDEIIYAFPELFDCFSSEGFDSSQFKNFARNFLRNNTETIN